MKRILAAVVMLVFLTPPALAQQRLQGDPEAVARVELMLERLGGAEVWARTRTLYMMYQGWRIDPDEPVIEEAWRDLAQPGEYIVFEGRSFKFERIFTRQAGWHVRNNEVRELTAEQQRAGLDFWPRDFYTMIRRFAVADQDLRLRFEAPRKVIVHDDNRNELGWWVIDHTGQPMLWGSMYEDEKLEYVYLPVKDFGNVNFPAGGAAVDGFWRFVYTEVDVSIDPIPVSLEMPGK